MEEEKKTITPEEEINYTTNTTDNESTLKKLINKNYRRY